MPALSGIKRADPVTYTARMGSESVTVTFDAARMTGRWERDIRKAIDDGDVDGVASRLFGVFIGWDVTDDQGVPVPISEEVLMDLPAKALANLFDGMRTAAVPASEEGNASSGTSSSPSTSSTVPPATALNGQATSPSPVLSTVPYPT